MFLDSVGFGTATLCQYLGINDHGLLHVLSQRCFPRARDKHFETPWLCFGDALSLGMVFFGERRPENLVLPRLKVGKDVAARHVCETHWSQTCSAGLFERRVDEFRDAVEGLDPISVAAAEYGIRDMLEGRILSSWFEALDPSDEMSSVIGWLTLVRGRDDDHGLVCGKIAVGAIETIDLCGVKAVRSGIRRNALGERLASATVGTIQNRQWQTLVSSLLARRGAL